MLCILSLILIAAPPLLAGEVLLEDFAERRDGYQHTLGGEFPGAQATFVWAQEGHDSRGALSIDFDFTDGGRYCQWRYQGWLPGVVDSLRFSARGAAGTFIIVRVVDATGQVHQFPAALDSDEWQRVAIPLDPAQAIAHWGGGNDGVIHQPLKSLFIGPEARDVTHGRLLLDGLAVTTSLPDEEIAMSRIDHFLANARVEVSSDDPGLLLGLGAINGASLRVRDVPPGIDEVRIALTCTDAYREPVPGAPTAVALTRGDGFRAAFAWRPPALGYYEFAYDLTVGGRAGASGRFAFGVVPEHVVGRRPESPFGVNTHFNQGWDPALGAIVRRAGVAWIRDGEAGLDDRALPVAQGQALCYMPCFTWYRKPLDEHRRPDGSYDFAEVAEWHREYAAKYGADIDAYDLVNEPHGPWSEVLGGDWSGGPWLDTFVQYGRQVSDAIHEADPGAKVLWEDIDQLLWYRRFIELGVGDAADGISPHPYNMHRSRPLPEDHAILGQMPEFARLLAANGLRWEVWSGEVGFSSFELTDDTPTGFYSPHTELAQANMLVRMMVLQLSAGIRRIFWYDFQDDGVEPHNPEHNFGLIHHDRTPKPAIVAYSYLIHRLTDCRWLGRCAIGGGADAVAYAAPSGEPTIIAWMRRGEKHEPIRVAGDASEMTATDIFGGASTLPVTGHSFTAPLSETPLYIDGLALDDINALLSAPPPP